MKNLIYTLRTLTPLHCGIGQGLNDIDMPTARHAVSGHPIIPSSSLKGVLKDEFKNGKYKQNMDSEDLVALFGGDGNSDFASAISVGDALLLALPVRSFFGTFAYLASPYTLQMFKNQFERMGNLNLPPIPSLTPNANSPDYKVMITNTSVLKSGNNNKVLLEELDLVIEAAGNDLAEKWASVIAKTFFHDEEGQNIFKKRFAIADDNALNFLCDTSLPVDAKISIDENTGTVKEGALWYQETISPETLFTGVTTVDRSFNKNSKKKSDEELSAILTDKNKLDVQVGGKATTGHGFVSLKFTTGV